MKETSFKVYAQDVVRTQRVKLVDSNGNSYYAKANNWEWKNEFYAYVDFTFRGKNFNVLCEVNPEFNY